MKEKEEMYYSLIGELIEPIKGVNNAFADGEPCARLYHEVQERISVYGRDWMLRMRMKMLRQSSTPY